MPTGKAKEGIPAEMRRTLISVLQEFEHRVRAYRRSDGWEVTLDLPASDGLVATLRAVHRDSAAEETHEIRYRPSSEWFIHTHVQCGGGPKVVRRLRSVEALGAHLSQKGALGEMFDVHPTTVSTETDTIIHHLHAAHKRLRDGADWILTIDSKTPGIVGGSWMLPYPLVASVAEHTRSGQLFRYEVGFDPERWCYVFRRLVDGRPEYPEQRFFSAHAFHEGVLGSVNAYEAPRQGH